MVDDEVSAAPPEVTGGSTSLLPHRVRRTVQQVMDLDAGVLRSETSLADAATRLAGLGQSDDATPSTEDWETTNIHQLATVLVEHARLRQETRGSHWREDFPERDDARWRVRLITHVDADGQLSTRKEPVTGEAE